ncbi:ATP-binding protein [Streptomyces sp. NEAU-H3]|nr:ATP-binding protein [Streptomyces sp. NEAU-H3]
MTGGPGAGKTTLLDALARRGHPITAEAGRAIIREQRACGGDALPWADRARFAELMVARDAATYAGADRAGPPVFFDRGLPDTIGYLRLEGLPVPPALPRAARALPYHPLPPRRGARPDGRRGAAHGRDDRGGVRGVRLRGRAAAVRRRGRAGRVRRGAVRGLPRAQTGLRASMRKRLLWARKPPSASISSCSSRRRSSYRSTVKPGTIHTTLRR